MSHSPLATLKRRLAAVALSVCMANPAAAANHEDLKLPNLGSTSTSLFSSQYERNLGRAWLGMYRSQVNTLNDPLLYGYLEDLLYKLVTHSDLDDRRIELVIADNPAMNAFAVPGGVVGVHSGLLLYAQTEGEFASVLAHEIGHLSQRHFSRRMQQQKANQPFTLAALLASLVLMAATNAQAGMAAISATQAAAQDAALRYSRANEIEADRVGMQILAKAGFDPNATAKMFERMMASTRLYSENRLPEFLRTHPLSETRVADARLRATRYPPVIQTISLDYQLMRTRVRLHQASSPQQAIKLFTAELDNKAVLQEAARYGLALALTKAGQTERARKELSHIYTPGDQKVAYILADAAIDSAEQRPDIAAKKLATALKQSPNNHPLTMAYAEALLYDGKPDQAEQLLLKHSRIRPNAPWLWYLLAEVQGLAGNITGLHQARAEFFILRGNLDQAEAQLGYALKEGHDDFITTAVIQQRLHDIHDMRETLQQF